MSWRLVPLSTPEEFLLNGEVALRGPGDFREVPPAELRALALQILALLATPDPSAHHYRLARVVLEEEAERDPLALLALRSSGAEGALDPLARSLANAVTRLLPLMQHFFAGGGRSGEDTRTADAVFADWVQEQFGEDGSAYGKLVRAEAQARWNEAHRWGGAPLLAPSSASLHALWVDPEQRPLPARWPRGLCRVLWWSHTRPRFERAQKRLPAVSGPIADALFRMHRSGVHLVRTEGGLVVRDPQEVEVATFQQITPPRVAAVQLGVAQQLAQTGVGLLGSLNAHRLLDWMIPEAHRRAENQEPDARTLVVEGGWSVLATLIGSTSKKSADDLHAIVAAMAYLAIPLPDQSIGNLLAYRDVPARGRRPGKVEIVLGTALMPHYVHELQGEDRILIPWPPAVPLVGRPNEHGAQRALRLRLLIELRKRARELVNCGGIRLTEEEWQALAQEALLPPSVLGPVQERWTRDGDDGPAFLRKIEPNSYTLGEAHRAVRDFLEDAGRRAEAGAKAGQKAVQRKKERLFRGRNS